MIPPEVGGLAQPLACLCRSTGVNEATETRDRPSQTVKSRRRPLRNVDGPAARQGKVLVVDDEPEMLALTRMVLQHAFPDLAIVTAHDGTAALDRLGRESFDVVLCDYRMPRMDGIQVLRAAAQRVPETRRVLLTAFTDPEIQRRAEHADVDFFVRKGVSADGLVETVRQALPPRDGSMTALHPSVEEPARHSRR